MLALIARKSGVEEDEIADVLKSVEGSAAVQQPAR